MKKQVTKSNSKMEAFKAFKNASDVIRGIKFNNVRIILICIILTISSNMFSQPQFLKRKYMKGFFIEKRAKTENKTVKKFTNNNSPVTENKPSDKVNIACKNDELIIKAGKMDILKELYCVEIKKEYKTSVVKNKTTCKPRNQYYAKHNTIFLDTTAAYCSNSNTVLRYKKMDSETTKNNEIKLIELGYKNKKMTNDFWITLNYDWFDFFNDLETMGATILLFAILFGLGYISFLFPIVGGIVGTILIIALVIIIGLIGLVNRYLEFYSKR